MVVDYSKSMVYVIANHVNDKLYIGSTTQSLSKRWYEHKRDCNSKRFNHRPMYQDMNEYGFDMFYITKVEDVSATDRQYLHKIEGYHIKRLRDDGIDLYNQMIAGRTVEESIKQYREDHRKDINTKQCEYYQFNCEEIKSKAREYHKENKLIINAKRREYYQSNKAEINSKLREKVICKICNSKVSQHQLTDHTKTIKHIKNFITY